MRRVVVLAVLAVGIGWPHIVHAQPPPEAGGQVAGAAIRRVGDMVVAEAQRTVVAYAVWVAEQERLAAEAAARAAQEQAAALARQRATQPVSRPSPAAVQVSGACGGATNGADQFIRRESGGDPNVWNTEGSGAWGCYQIMPYVWRATCSDLGAHGSASPAAQAQCASRLPLSAWGGG